MREKMRAGQYEFCERRELIGKRACQPLRQLALSIATICHFPAGMLCRSISGSAGSMDTAPVSGSCHDLVPRSGLAGNSSPR